MLFVILRKLQKLLDEMEIIIVPISSGSYENFKRHTDKSIYDFAWLIINLLISNKTIHLLLEKTVS